MMMEKAADPEPQKLYTRMRLWEFSDQYVIEPTDGSSGSCLAISRVDASMSSIDEIPHCSTVRVPKIQTVFGVVGMLKLVAGSYLLIITERECVGSYLGHPIFKVTSLKVLPCDQSLRSSSVEQKRMKAEFSALLSVAERTHGLYFSYDVNITLRDYETLAVSCCPSTNIRPAMLDRALGGKELTPYTCLEFVLNKMRLESEIYLYCSAQRLHDLGDESKLLPLWRQADPRFLWNNYIMEVLIENKLDPFLLPVLQGSFNNFQASIGRDVIDVTLIARRCHRRSGTRMWRRGADSDGYVANFVESEQIIQITGFRASFVQVRGSIPISWDQIVDLTYKPKFEIVRLDEAPRVAERHFLDLRKRYGSAIAIDLVNSHGGEGRLSEKFSDAMQHVVNEDVRYLHFDFHQICGHVHFERLSILYDQIEDFLVKTRYFLLNENGEKLEAQHGVVRTNCIDCLDRTNVTQSMIGKKLIEFQLRRLGIFNAEETISAHPNLDDNLKILWANHGDDISIQYSGTPALKGDFVRYGKRTVNGIFNDGCNALMRYYLNNFCDGTKQDAIDLLHGHYIVSVSRDMTQTSQKGGVEAVASFPMAFALIMTGLFFTIISLRGVRNNPWNLLFSMFWASISLGMAGFVKANGRVFCNRPHLHQPRR